MGKRIDMSGKTYGRLEVIEFAYTKNGRAYWKCRCSCGNITTVTGKLLRSGKTKSCGCLKLEKLMKNGLKHGLYKTRFYAIYGNMLTRCNNPNSCKYKNYGGRGIKCEWLSFNDFYKDMYQSYLDHVKEFGESNTSIDRIDVNGNYNKKNCRWATWEEQANNKTTNHTVEIDNKIMTMAQAAKKYEINYQTAASRLQRGMDFFGNKL